MLWLLALLMPPLAILFCGKPFQAILNIPLCCLLWIPGVIHAMAVVSETKADARAERVAESRRR